MFWRARLPLPTNTDFQLLIDFPTSQERNPTMTKRKRFPRPSRQQQKQQQTTGQAKIVYKQGGWKRQVRENHRTSYENNSLIHDACIGRTASQSPICTRRDRNWVVLDLAVPGKINASEPARNDKLLGRGENLQHLVSRSKKKVTSLASNDLVTQANARIIQASNLVTDMGDFLNLPTYDPAGIYSDSESIRPGRNSGLHRRHRIFLHHHSHAIDSMSPQNQQIKRPWQP